MGGGRWEILRLRIAKGDASAEADASRTRTAQVGDGLPWVHKLAKLHLKVGFSTYAPIQITCVYRVGEMGGLEAMLSLLNFNLNI